jgi:class 3 adenylate cyclase
VKRKIAAILAADIAGYSRLVAEDEEETLRRLGTHRAVFGDFVARHGGRIFNTAGDATLAEFESAVDAIRCAVDVQESLRTRNLGYAPSRHMNYRIGITIGDVVERDGDLLGDGVNIASRLEAFAPAGGICISRAVHKAVTNKISLKFDDAGPLQLKNIPERVHAYTVALDGQSPAPRAIAWRALGLAAVLMIAATMAGTYLVTRSLLPVDTSSGKGNTSPPTAEAQQSKTAVSQAAPETPAARSSTAREEKPAPVAADTAAGPTAASAPEQISSTAPEQEVQADKEGNACRRYLPSVGRTVEVPCEDGAQIETTPAARVEAPKETEVERLVFTGQWARDAQACARTHSSDESLRFAAGSFSIYPYICTQGNITPLGSAAAMVGQCQTSEPGFSPNETVRLTIEGDRLSVSGDSIRVSGYIRCVASMANTNTPAAITAVPARDQPQPSTPPGNQESGPFKGSSSDHSPSLGAQTRFSAEQLARKYGPLVKEGRQWYLRKGLAVIGVGYKELGGLKDDFKGTSLEGCKKACATDQPRCRAFHWGGGVGIVPICHLYDSHDLDTVTASAGTVGFKQ